MGPLTAGPNSARDADGAPACSQAAPPGRGGVIGDNASARSTKLAEPANTVVQGTLIPAVLETAIDTDVPGYVRAVVSQDVRSFDGSRVLIPRSSRLIGEYKGASQAGQRRAYLDVDPARPSRRRLGRARFAGGDFSGQAGIGGQVNSHFFSRFGSAILLSILGGASTLVDRRGVDGHRWRADQSAASAAHSARRQPRPDHQGSPRRADPRIHRPRPDLLRRGRTDERRRSCRCRPADGIDPFLDAYLEPFRDWLAQAGRDRNSGQSARAKSGSSSAEK